MQSRAASPDDQVLQGSSRLTNPPSPSPQRSRKRRWTRVRKAAVVYRLIVFILRCSGDSHCSTSSFGFGGSSTSGFRTRRNLSEPMWNTEISLRPPNHWDTNCQDFVFSCSGTKWHRRSNLNSWPKIFLYDAWLGLSVKSEWQPNNKLPKARGWSSQFPSCVAQWLRFPEFQASVV